MHVYANHDKFQAGFSIIFTFFESKTGVKKVRLNWNSLLRLYTPTTRAVRRWRQYRSP